MKKYLVFVFAMLFVGALATGALAAGKSNVAHLYLYQKDGDPNWNIVDGGAWGKMKYNLLGEEFEFVFNGHGLEPGEDYFLIYYPDPGQETVFSVLAPGLPTGIGYSMNLVRSKLSRPPGLKRVVVGEIDT